MTIHLHQGDLPDGIDWGDAVAIDSETMGLIPGRDRLCLVQLSAGDGDAHLVQFRRPASADLPDYSAPNLRRLLTDYGFRGHPLRKDYPADAHTAPWR